MLVVRVRIRVRIGERVAEVPALVNSGYSSETSQLLIPVEFARDLGLWPPEGAEESVFETAGGPIRVWIMAGAAKISVAGEKSSPEIISDIVISQLIDEVLMSDTLTSDLGIALEDPKRGLWRFRWEPPDRVRRSVPPKYW